MSGDSSNHEKKKDDESVLLGPEGSGHKPLAGAGTAAVVAPEPPPELVNTSPDDEKQEFIKRKEDSEKVRISSLSSINQNQSFSRLLASHE